MSDFSVFEAIEAGDLDALKEACTGKRDLSGHNREGWTALHLAAFHGRLEMVEWLLGRGADVHAVSANSMSNQPLHAALAGEQNPGVVQRLVTAGADVNAAAGAGVTPLHLAAARGDQAMVRLLLDAGATPRPMEDGKTPADLAEERGHGKLAGLS